MKRDGEEIRKRERLCGQDDEEEEQKEGKGGVWISLFDTEFQSRGERDHRDWYNLSCS